MIGGKGTHNPRVSQWYRRIAALHGALPFYLVPTGHALPAWHYFFEVTRRCNLRCSMCQYGAWTEENPPAEQIERELSTAEWKDVIDQTGPLSLITFTGGEPWVRGGFDEILEYASRKRRTHVITNGLLLTEERVRSCVALAPKRLGGRGLGFIGVSVDGTEAVHDRIRGREGAFIETFAALRAITRQRAAAGTRCPIVHVTAVMLPENTSVLHELPALCSEAGVPVLNLTIEIRFPGTQGIGNVPLDGVAKARVTLPRIEPSVLAACIERTQAAAKAAGVELRLPAMPIEQVLRYYDGGQDLSAFMCRNAWTNLHVGPEGAVSPCTMYQLGNVREHPLRKLWNGEKMRAFRRQIRKRPFPICQGCCHIEYRG